MNGNRHGNGERRKEEVVMKYLIITMFLWLGALIVHEMGKGNG